MWKEAIMANVNVLSRSLSSGTEKISSRNLNPDLQNATFGEERKILDIRSHSS